MTDHNLVHLDGSIELLKENINRLVDPRDYQASRNDRHHPAKYLHRYSCLVHETHGGVCDCDRIPNPAFTSLNVNAQVKP